MILLHFQFASVLIGNYKLTEFYSYDRNPRPLTSIVEFIPKLFLRLYRKSIQNWRKRIESKAAIFYNSFADSGLVYKA